MLRENQFPSSNIIVMMHDDVPRYRYIQGGIDYHEDLVVDYTSHDFTIDAFKNVMSGGRLVDPQGRKVLGSTTDDNVLLYFSGPSLMNSIYFPNRPVIAAEIQDILNDAYDGGKYDNMYLVMEAFNSGNVLNQLRLENLFVYALASVSDKWVGDVDYYSQSLLNVHPFTELWIKNVKMVLGKFDVWQFVTPNNKLHRRLIADENAPRN
ncbi:unnamed protein product [Calicophoron daubneyi]|uniref:Uncharacterized protein n=1 Tax=Calicophoron daubneyi TaxID=300641 RepID=A0AAV2U2L3_CALDB